MTSIRFGIAALAGAVLPLLSGCSHDPPPAAAAANNAPPPCATPEPLKVTLKASAQINPGEKGEALATVIRIYQLKGTSKLQGASFDDLLDRDKDVLGDELAGATEVTINPGDTVEPPLVRSPEAGYIAAVALFRRPAGNTWRAMKRLAPPDPQHCHPAKGGTGAMQNDNTVRFSVDENRVDIR